jgi:nitrile hydratase accessory protein
VIARTLEELMKSAAIEPRDVVFHSPWEARTFAIALSLAQSGKYEWEEFRRLLIAEISNDSDPGAPSDEYYRRFLRALEKLLSAKRMVGAEEMARRMQQLRSP